MAGEISSRLRLFLRGERALGLAYLPVPPGWDLTAKGKVASVESRPAAPTPPRFAPRTAAAVPRPGPAATTAAPLMPGKRPAAAAPVPAAGEASPSTAPPSTAAPPKRAALFYVGQSASPARASGPSQPPFPDPPLSSARKIEALVQLDAMQVKGCVKCPLSGGRTCTVFGEGNVDADLFFIGEGPGADEDRTGRPFVGRAGQLLDKMIASMGLERSSVYIANLVKCRPPDNREPTPGEIDTCSVYLLEQLNLVRPKVIVTLGRPASQYLLNSKTPMSRLRGQWHSWRGIRLMPTFHPAYVLRQYTNEVRQAVWSDLRMVMAELGLPEPARRPE